MSSYKAYLNSLQFNYTANDLIKTKELTGILLVNTGTPSSLNYWDIRRYLKQFLSDKRIIELTNWIWYPILYLFILPFRPFNKAKAYKSIWNWELNESPLLTLTKRQCEKVSTKLELTHGKDKLIVDWAFRFGDSSINDKIKKLIKEGCKKIVVFPLFPQYAGATIGGINDEVYRTFLCLRVQPELVTISTYYRNPKYIQLLGDSILEHLLVAKKPIQVLLFTYHGLPLEYCIKGDTYPIQCNETTAFVTSYLRHQITKKASKYHQQLPLIQTTYSSRFGPSEWLKPYTDVVVKELIKTDVKSLAIIAPSFHSDCLETWEELRDDLGDLFCSNIDDSSFLYINCLNDKSAAIDMICDIIKHNLPSNF
uniref:Ferrochelatase n=1 Tax=Rhabditophanes sp. KR3021 TaxID=114890 RepID=A0AC35UCQ6_9BILA